MMKSILLALTLFLAVSCEFDKRMILRKFLDGPTKELFKVYHLLYEKTYELNSDEGLRRYKIFKNTLAYINKRNAQNLSFKLGINQFSDLTKEEYKKRLIPKDIFKKQKEEFLRFLAFEYVNFDEEADKESWDTQNFSANWTHILVPPKDQKQCGDCWAFSAVGALEGNYYVKNKLTAPVSFSEQQLTSCAKSGCDGCNGGLSNYAFKYTATNGIQSETSYPFTSGSGSSGSCKYNKAQVVGKNVNYTYCTNDNTVGEKVKACSLATWQQMLSYAPFSVYMEADSDDFQNYDSGVLSLTSNDCSNGSDHAVLAVGWGVDATCNKTYVLVRNSWSTSWGENGYFRIEYDPSNYDTCYITGSAFQPNF